MENVINLLERIESTSKRTEKELLLSEFKDKETLKFVLETVYNPYLVYGVVEWDDGSLYNESIPTMYELLDLRDDLTSKKITGHAARDSVRDLTLCENEIARKWLIRMFKKDLKAGFGIKTINKIFNKLIPTFDIGLCDTFEYIRGETAVLPEGDFTIEPKLDGFRCLIFIENGICKFMSRNNKPLFNTQIIEREILDNGYDNCVLDGEIIADDWNETASIVMTEDEPHAKIDTLHFHCFDALLIDEWRSKETKPISVRRARITSLLTDHVQFVEHYNCSKNFLDAQKIFDGFKKQGYEGAVLKRLASKYPFGERKDWIKWKEFITVDVIIKYAAIGKGKNSKRLGAFYCDYNGVEVRVGGGYTDEQREKFWKDKDKMVGLIIEVKAQEATKDKSLRFPTFLRVRKDLN